MWHILIRLWTASGDRMIWAIQYVFHPSDYYLFHFGSIELQKFIKERTLTDFPTVIAAYCGFNCRDGVLQTPSPTALSHLSKIVAESKVPVSSLAKYATNSDIQHSIVAITLM
ncbi:hypothetical protein KFK09_006120 [Dendrobium nobile]|uniref:Uncharacterized protein n=1 Tax=Dendrobium nobile TaxID=94219 RepID=A0A8T3BTL5_DENNO|nr:hypothetical protein KFK09_006120 [Dendrobium nobile]